MLEIADTSVHQLGASTAGRLGEIVGLDQGGSVTPTRRIDRDPEPGRPAPDHQDVEGLVAQPIGHVRTIESVAHRSSSVQSSVRSTDFRHQCMSRSRSSADIDGSKTRSIS